MSKFLWQTFVTLLVIIDPFVVVPVFIALTRSDTHTHRKQIAKKTVFPLAIPLIAGPGAMTSIVVLMREAEHVQTFAGLSVILIAVFVLLLTYMTMCLGEKLMKVLGVIGMNVLTRVFGVIVAALATQHIVHGVTAVVKGMR